MELKGKRLVARLLSSLVDFLTCTFFSVVSLTPILFIELENVDTMGYSGFALFISSFVSGAMLVIFIIFYMIAIPSYLDGSTFGKRLFKLELKKIDGTKVAFYDLFEREMIRIVCLVFTFGISMIANVCLIVFSKKHQSFQDCLCGTHVIDKE